MAGITWLWMSAIVPIFECFRSIEADPRRLAESA
jgi:hypothetical protein